VPGHPPRPVTDDEIAEVCAEWRRMLERWEALPIGGSLELTWQAERPRRAPRPRRADGPRLHGRSARWSAPRG
jgi:hypothetical protein